MWYRTASDAFEALGRDDGWAIASHIALSTLMSLFPFLIFVTALTGFLFGTEELADQVADLLLEAWPKEVAGPIASQVARVLTTAHGGPLTFGVVLALYFSSSGIESLRIGLNRAYGEIEMRPWWLLRLESIAYVLVGAAGLITLAFLIVLAPLLFGAALPHAPWLAGLERGLHLRPVRHRDGGAGDRAGAGAQMAALWPPPARRDRAGHRGDAGRLDRAGRRIRPLSRPVLRQLCHRPMRGSPPP